MIRTIPVGSQPRTKLIWLTSSPPCGDAGPNRLSESADRTMAA